MNCRSWHGLERWTTSDRPGRAAFLETGPPRKPGKPAGSSAPSVTICAGFLGAASARRPRNSGSEVRRLSGKIRLREIRAGFEPAFWIANVTELFERLSYYGQSAVLAIFLHESLHLSAQQTGSA